MMDTKFKKTALGDDALIYQRSKDTISKEEIKKLPFRQRIGYFKDYYLKITIVVIIAAIALGSLLNTTVFNRSNCVLALCFLNGSAIQDGEGMSSFLEEYLGMENKNDYISTETFLLDNYQMNMAYTTRISAKSIDLIICSRDDFMEQSERGMLCDLRELLPEEMQEQLSDRFLENGIAQMDDNYNIVSHSDPAPFGIDLTGSEAYKEYGGTDTQPVLCAAANVTNTENAIRAIAWFTGVPEPLLEQPES